MCVPINILVDRFAASSKQAIGKQQVKFICLFNRTFSYIKLIEYQTFTAKDVDKDTFEGNLFELFTLRAIDFKEYSF